LGIDDWGLAIDHAFLERVGAKIIVFDPLEETIKSWIK
jgi:hypothetical protein